MQSIELSPSSTRTSQKEPLPLLPRKRQPQNPNYPLKIGKDETNLMKLPSDYKDSFVEKHGVKLRLMSGFVKAAISTLQKQPILNVVIECIFCECCSWFF
ncbi:dihydrolipoyllysine-residue succinyltransferase component of 2-oxoglutarate dehydrogenase complex [Striga asiatica]|uniref:Dihydrolipoyllysine-residue succinyltransferase component of 2-oxoglutarate dehydrogenase complex n=1 Tax=Striga asiatica TaxID=4170 RepID=A0A5A7Q0Z8_STRAF|nr:dihydrolipoyllysine-residue succinyltransferase component of 2-oxoglutarate dehydrogenase complex [Striga asiatica]